MSLVGPRSVEWRGLQALLRAGGETAPPMQHATPIWVGRNGPRIDARIVDGDGREHHVVAHQAADGLTLVAVFSEPDPVPSSEATVIVVNGPSGAGKSSVLAALAADTSVPWVVFDEPVVGSVDPRFLLWGGRVPQLQEGMLAAMAALARAGNRIALAAGGRSQPDLEAAFGDLRVVWVGLDCDPRPSSGATPAGTGAGAGWSSRACR